MVAVSSGDGSDVALVLCLHRLGWSVRAIARRLGLSRMGVHRIVQRAADEVAADDAAAEPDTRAAVVARKLAQLDNDADDAAGDDELEELGLELDGVLAPDDQPEEDDGLDLEFDEFDGVLAPDGGPSGRPRVSDNEPWTAKHLAMPGRYWTVEDHLAGRCSWDDLNALHQYRVRYRRPAGGDVTAS